MKNKFLNTLLGVILLYLLIVFIGSSVISQHNNKKAVSNNDDLIKYATAFLTEDNLIQKGIQLDCSSFTRLVYKKLNINLPRNAIEQYNSCKLNSGLTNPGDLVFFSMNNKEINHVGLMLNDSVFIHSPGKRKPVRTDNIKSEYWLKYYRGKGEIAK